MRLRKPKKKHILNCDPFDHLLPRVIQSLLTLSRKTERGFGRVRRLAVFSLLAGFWLQCRILIVTVNIFVRTGDSGQNFVDYFPIL
jgi:hypothetical protein